MHEGRHGNGGRRRFATSGDASLPGITCLSSTTRATHPLSDTSRSEIPSPRRHSHAASEPACGGSDDARNFRTQRRKPANHGGSGAPIGLSAGSGTRRVRRGPRCYTESLGPSGQAPTDSVPDGRPGSLEAGDKDDIAVRHTHLPPRSRSRSPSRRMTRNESDRSEKGIHHPNGPTTRCALAYNVVASMTSPTRAVLLDTGRSIGEQGGRGRCPRGWSP